jgi:hypothetical protein
MEELQQTWDVFKETISKWIETCDKSIQLDTCYNFLLTKEPYFQEFFSKNPLADVTYHEILQSIDDKRLAIGALGSSL